MPFRPSARVVVCAPALLVAAVAGNAHAQSTLKAGPEFQVNQYTTGDQAFPSAVAAPDGTYFIVWESNFQDGDATGIFGRLVSAVGVPLGPEFRVNEATLSAQTRPSVAVDPAGRFTVVWASPDGSGSGVFARQFSAGGPLGPQFQVNAYTTGEQTLPRVSAGAGGLAVVWQSAGQDGSGLGVFGRLFTPGGAPATGEIPLSTTTALDQRTPAVAALDSGRYAAAWLGNAGSERVVYSRLFGAGGAPLTPETIVSTTGFAAVRDHVTVTAGPVGTAVVGWWEGSTFCGKFGCQSGDAGILLRYLDANGIPGASGGAGGAGAGSIARWEGAVASNFTGRVLVSYTSSPGILPCFHIPPPTPPEMCPANGPEDGSGSGIFARGITPASPPRVQANTFTTGDQSRSTVASDPYGNALVAWQSAGQDGSGVGIYAQRFGGLFAASVAADPAGNGVLDPDLSEEVRPSWRNLNGAAQPLGGSLFGFVGPAGGTYTIDDATASYGTVPNGATQSCTTDCYRVTVSLPAGRPAVHMDSYAGESLTVDVHRPWILHVGGSFTDVSSASPFYRFIETLLHNGVTTGCGGTRYCPIDETNREQMAVFVLVSKEGPAYVPPACTTPLFLDVPPTNVYCRWIEELARRGVVGGCGGGYYCPTAFITREQMAVFVLRTLDPTLNPPACTTPLFADVPASSPFCRWIEELARRGVVSGCGGGYYCPTAPVTREQMAVFLATTFGLRLY